MLTLEDIRTVPVFSILPLDEQERLVRTSADLHLAAGEFAVPEGGATSPRRRRAWRSTRASTAVTSSSEGGGTGKASPS